MNRLTRLVGIFCCSRHRLRRRAGGARRGLSVAACSSRDLLSARRHCRFCRPRAGAAARSGARPDDRRRQPAGRGRHRRRRLGRARGTGRLRPGTDRSVDRHQPGAAQEDAVRRVQGSGADLAGRLVAGRAGGGAATADQNLRGAGRLRQGQSGQAQFRVAGYRHHWAIWPARCSSSDSA